LSLINWYSGTVASSHIEVIVTARLFVVAFVDLRRWHLLQQ